MDPYVEHDSLTLLLDLILLKRGVYRHLLYNRGSRPRRAVSDPKAKSQDGEVDNDTTYLSRARWIWTLKLGTALIVLDACASFGFDIINLKLIRHSYPMDTSTFVIEHVPLGED